MVKLSIVTLNYKTPDVTNACIDSVQKMLHEEFEKGLLEHIVVDNCSEDNSTKTIENHIKSKKYKNVNFVQSPINGGFGAGNNFGVKYSKGENILFLNSDTILEDKNILKMISFLEENKDAAVIGGQLKNKDGSLQVAGWKFYSLINVVFLLLGFERLGIISSANSNIKKVDWVTGGCFMIKKDIFEKAGRFDEKIFMYTEDMELCFRVNKIGYNTYLYPNISITHLSQRSSNRTFAIVNIYKGIEYFYKKHKPLWQYYVVKLLLKSKALILISIGRLTSNAYLSETYEKALAVS